MSIHIQRVYDLDADEGGQYILIDGLWPRGISKAKLRGVRWMKNIAPSAELRTWFGHDPAKWDEFRRRYFRQLDDNADALTDLRRLARSGRLTLLYGAHDETRNNAVALRDYLKS